MASVLPWTPDEGGHCDPIAGMPVSEAVRRFGVAPLWVSCWACFAGGLSEEDCGRLLEADARRLYYVVHRHEANWVPFAPGLVVDQFSPMVHTFLDALPEAPETAETAEEPKKKQPRKMRNANPVP
jgi:hypothetical protein